MSARISGLVVTLKEDASEETADRLAQLITLIGGVAGVRPVEADIAEEMARMRVDQQWRNGLLHFLKERLDEHP